MQHLKYLILAIILFNIPSFVLLQLGQVGLASTISYFSFLLLIIYYLITPKGRLLWPFILIGISYYVFSCLQPHLPFDIYFTEAVKFFIVVICANELSKRCTSQEIVYFLLLGGGERPDTTVFVPK